MAASMGPGPALTNDPTQNNQTQPNVAASANGTGGGFGSLMSQWSDWLTDPKNKNSLLQFGADMLQPPSAGQSALGQLGQAAADSSEVNDRAVQENQALKLSQAESNRQNAIAQSEGDLREAQGEYYRGRGAAASGAAKGLDSGTKRAAVLANLYNKLLEQMQFIDDPAELAQEQQFAEQVKTQLRNAMNEPSASAAPAPGASGASAAPAASAPPAGMTQEKAIALGKAAIAGQGMKPKSPADVAAMIKSWGFDPSGLTN